MGIQEQIFKDYCSGELNGWLEKTRPGLAKEQFNLLSSQGVFSQFKLFGQSRITAGQKMMLYDVCRKAIGKDTPNYAQQIGDCVSFGMKNANEHIQCTDMFVRGVRENFKLIFPPYHYGTGKVFVGGEHSYEDGSLGSWMAAAVQKYGCLSCDEPNVPAYSGKIATQWGHDGPADNFVKTAKNHLIKSAAQINNWNDLVAAIVNGYPCTTASDIGYDMNASSDGFFRQTQQWGHQMCGLPDLVIKSLQPKKLCEVQVGDKIIGKDGKLHKVTQVFRRPYKGKISCIKAYGALPLKVTTNHPVLIYRENNCEIENYHQLNMTEGNIATLTKTKKKLRPLWVNASEIKPGDYLATPGMISDNCEPIIPQWISNGRINKNQPKEIYQDDDIAWLLGLYLADGSSEKNHKIVITLGIKEKEYCERCIKAFAKLGLTCSFREVGQAIRIIVYSAVLANSFKTWFGQQTNKHIPDWLWTWNNLDKVVDGVYAGDGNLPSCREQTGKRIVNTSRILIDQLHTILVSKGFKCSVSERKHKNRPTWNKIYVLEWSNEDLKKTFNMFDGNNLLLKVYKNIEEDYTGEVFNLEVENSHTYVAENCVIHNCFIGIDDNDKDPYAIILNNWGDSHGQLKDFDNGENLPIGVLRVRRADAEKHINAGETYAISQYDGYPEQLLDKDLFKVG